MASCPSCGSRPILKTAAPLRVRYCRKCGPLLPTAPVAVAP